MKKKQLLNSVSMAVLALAVSACGSSNNEPATGAAQAYFGQSASAAGTPYVGISDEELGWRAEVPETQTALLNVQNDYNFDASRRTVVTMSVPQAVGEKAEASFCTDYSFDGVDYEVDYDSCVLHAPLVNGQVSEEINLGNHHSSVLGIVWLQDSNADPVYKEFNFD